MKRLLTICISLLSSLLSFAQFTGRVSDSQGVEYTANNDETTCYVSRYYEENSSINIPEVYEGRRVTSIGLYAFSGCSELTSVTIPSSVTSIGPYAFYKCSGLTSVTIPSSVTSIGPYAFVYCSGLTSVIIPSSVTSIGHHAFDSCIGLTSIIISEGVTSIGLEAFKRCSGLTSITIPSSVTSIGEFAFEHSGLTSIRVINEVPILLDIYNSPFSYGFPKSVTLYVPIGSKELYEAADVWKNFIEIKEWFDISCGSISDLQGIQYTANDDETTCYVSGHDEKYSSEIVIPKYFAGRQITSIKEGAFAGCSDINSISIGLEEPLAIDGSVFGGLNYQSATLYVPKGCIDAYRAANVWNNFGDMKELFDKSDGDLSDSQGVKYKANNDETTCYVSDRERNYSTTITIPEVFRGRRVTSIGQGAFSWCRASSITIPSSVTSISDRAFYDCSGLTSVAIPSSVISIGGGAFDGCSGLTSITIPSSVKSISNGGLSGLSSIIVEEGNPAYDSRENCNAIIRTSDNKLIAGCKNSFIPSSVTSIGENAFSGCSGLTSVTIPSSVTSIGDHAFRDCSGLASIVVDENNSVFDSRENCNAIIKTSDNTLILGCKNTIIPRSVTSIGAYAFYDCSGLTSVTIPSSVTSIGYSAFGICTGLTSVKIPSSVTSIGGFAFDCCDKLTSVKVEWETPFAIEYSVFSRNLTLYVPKGTKEAYEAANGWSYLRIIEYDKYNVLNEEDTTVPTSAIDVNVKVMRTINANEWSTICLPFAMTAEKVTAAFGDDVKIGDFDGYDTTEGDGDVVLAISMKFKQVTAMEANHPYVIKVSSKITEFAVDGVDLVPVENPVWVKTSGEMVGTYVAETVIPSGSMFLSGNKFWYSVGTSKMKAFRAYFHLNDVLPDLNGLEPAARVYLAFEDETTEIDATLMKSNEEPDNIGWHTLDGRKLAKMPTKKGVYVANGRKVVIK